MTLQDVLKIAQQDESLWFRPVSLKGAKWAYIVKNGEVYSVPSARGGDYGVTAYVKYLLDDWEIVTADQVLDGE